MKTITINDKVITFDLGEELRAKDLAKIQRVQAKSEQGQEIDMMFGFVREFCSLKDLELVENMNVSEFTEFSEGFAKLIDFEGKMKEVDEKKKE